MRGEAVTLQESRWPGLATKQRHRLTEDLSQGDVFPDEVPVCKIFILAGWSSTMVEKEMLWGKGQTPWLDFMSKQNVEEPRDLYLGLCPCLSLCKQCVTQEKRSLS